MIRVSHLQRVLAGLAFAVVVALPTAAPAQTPARKPNIVII